MISIYHKSHRDRGLRKLSEFRSGSWIYVEEPTEAELTRLVAGHGLDAGHLHDALDPNEVPRFETEGNVNYIITRVPYERDGKVTTIPVLIVLHPDFFMTVVARKTGILDTLISKPALFRTTHSMELFIRLFFVFIDRYNSELSVLNKKIVTASQTTERITNRTIIELVHLEHTVNSLVNVMVRTNAILNSMLTGKSLHLNSEERELVEDLFLATGQLTDLLKSSMLNVRNIREAFATIINNNLNRVIKFFTALTIVMTIPTIIASFFGMNVRLPFEASPLAFGLITLTTVFFCLLVLAYFYKKDWL